MSRQHEPQPAPHPLRMIKDRYKEAGFDSLSTSVGLSRLLGCSEALIRNTEKGVIKTLSWRLADRVERVTGVSAKWLMTAEARWREGCADDRAVEILDVSGKAWSPSSDTPICFVDGLTDVVELLYLHKPESLPLFMGAVMQAVLTIRPPHDELRSRHLSMLGMKRYMNRWIIPVIRFTANLSPPEKQQFFQAVTDCLGASSSAELKTLRKLWPYLHGPSKDGTTWVKEPRIPRNL